MSSACAFCLHVFFVYTLLQNECRNKKVRPCRHDVRLSLTLLFQETPDMGKIERCMVFRFCRSMLCISTTGWPYGCLSDWCILSKRINVSSYLFHHRIATLFSFCHIKRYGNIPTTPSPNWGVECR